MKRSLRLSTVVAAAVALGLSAAGSAAAFTSGQAQLKGTVTSFDGKFDLHVLDKKGDVHDVKLHQGTIINPTGLTLESGMKVTILGSRAGSVVDANEIDTPYHEDLVARQNGSVYGYGYPVGYGYGGYGGYPYGYGYGYGGYGGFGYPYGGLPYGAYPAGYAQPSVVRPGAPVGVAPVTRGVPGPRPGLPAGARAPLAAPAPVTRVNPGVVRR